MKRKKASLQRKLTLWFSAALVLAMGLTFAAVFLVSHAVLQKNLRDELIRTVEDNVDEVEFRQSVSPMRMDGDGDQYIRYQGGYLEIDDDYLDQVGGVITALYREGGELLYGETPVALNPEAVGFAQGDCRQARVGGELFYLYDRALEGSGLQGLWLRGVVSERQGDAPLARVACLSAWLLTALVLVAIGGGVWIARRALRPIRLMSETAARIGSGDDLKRRIPMDGGGDELSRLAETFNDMMRRLEVSFEAERQFTSDVSHELRTPLSVITAQCDDALEQERSGEEYREALEVVRRQTRRMTRLTENMLTLARLEREAVCPVQESVDLSELTLSVAGDMALLQEKGISLQCRVDPGVCVTGDHCLLARLLANLLSNAYRYGRENGHIDVSVRRTDGFAELTVADDGIGIAPDQQERIFHRFYQAASARSGGGVGLGLAMARQIVRLHGGELSVRSRPGEGSAFTARFPEAGRETAPQRAET